MSKQPLVSAISTSQIGLPSLFPPPTNSTTHQPSIQTVFGNIGPNASLLGTPSIPTVFGNPVSVSAPATRSNRHTRRCAYYYRGFFRAFQFLSQPIQDKRACGRNQGQAPMFTEEEVKTYEEITQKLAAMYNKRFNGYRELVAIEKGLEPAPYTKTNKYILKCVE